MKRIGIITGLRSEARCLAGTPIAENAEVRVAAAVSAQAFDDARELIALGCQALISFGIAGGLDPRIRSGSLILANEVVTRDGERFSTDTTARKALHKLIGLGTHISHSPVFGSDQLIFSPRRKINLHLDTGAAAVDMESHSVARAAADAGVPFLVVRVVSDNAYHRLPKSIRGSIAPNGGVKTWKVARNLFIRPYDLPSLIRLRRDSAVAHRCLRRVATSGGPFLGFG